MQDSIAYIKNLEKEGFDRVYEWDAQPNEEDLDHIHDFDTRLVILEGQIEVKMNGKSYMLKKGETIDIPRKIVHYGKASSVGCKYIVAEKHL